MASLGLYWAIGAYPKGLVPSIRYIKPSADFNKLRISIIELLLENRGNINHRLETYQMEELYPIIYTVKADTIKRVKWLLNKGVDPNLKGL
jgi:hypothetical protein